MSRRAPGEGHIYQDDRGRWMGLASAGTNPRTGKRRRVKITGRPGESKSSVAKRLKARIDELKASSPSSPKTVGQLVDHWRDVEAPDSMGQATLDNVDSLIAVHITPVFESVKIGALTAEDVDEFLRARAEDYSKSTIIKLRSILKMSFDFAVKRRHAQWNPAAQAKVPRDAGTVRKGRALTRTDADKLLDVADSDRLGVWVTVAITLGLRPGEVSGLEWGAVDFENGQLVVHQSLSWPKGGPVLKEPKTKAPRVLDMPARTVAALRRHKASQAEERLLMGAEWPDEWKHLVFVSSVGTPLRPRQIRLLVAKLAKQAKIKGKVRPYDLRHTATSLMSASGMPPERLADLLGHKDTRMVFDHYRHPVTASVSTAAEYWG